MATWVDNVHRRAALIIDQIRAFEIAGQKGGMDVSGALGMWYRRLDELYSQSYALGQLLDNSDIVFHAEGPGAAQGLPWLSALNKILGNAEKSLRALSATALDLLGTDGKRLSKEIDLRLTGLAPGSLYAGIKFMPPAADLLPEDAEVIRIVSEGATQLPNVARFIDDEGLRPGIEEASPDPAVRDIQLITLMNLSPTGKSGIHTLGISSAMYGESSLGQRERVVLRQVLSRPDTRRAQPGSFIGEVREADLDKTRIHLRDVKDIGSLRCVLRELTVDDGRQLLGRRIRVSGHYLTDRAGRPRLLYVDSIDPVPEPRNLPL